MPIHPLFDQMNLFKPEEALIWFILSTIAFLLLCGGVLRWSRTAATKLIAIGILAAVVSVGYGGFVVPPVIIPLTAGLMKIAVILVLGGVACNVLSAIGCPIATDTAKPKEPKEPVHE